MFSDSFVTALLEDDSIIGQAVELILPNEVIRIHTGVGELVIEGNTYLGVGQLGRVAAIESASDDKPVTVDVSLSGIPGNLLSDALGTRIRGSSARVLIFVQDESGNIKAAADSVVGLVTEYNVEIGDDNTIQVGISDEFALYEHALNNYWSEQSQLALHPGDHICRFTAQMADREVYWGAKEDAPGFVYE